MEASHSSLREMAVSAIAIEQLSHSKRLELPKSLLQHLSANAQRGLSAVWPGSALAERMARFGRREAQSLSTSDATESFKLDSNKREVVFIGTAIETLCDVTNWICSGMASAD